MAELKKLHIMTSPDTMSFHPDLESISAILPDDDFDYYDNLKYDEYMPTSYKLQG